MGSCVVQFRFAHVRLALVAYRVRKQANRLCCSFIAPNTFHVTDENAPDFEVTRTRQQQFKRKYISSAKKNKKSRRDSKSFRKKRK